MERTADESSSSIHWCLAFTASTLHSLCPDVFLNAYPEMDGGSVVVDRCRRFEWVFSELYPMWQFIGQLRSWKFLCRNSFRKTEVAVSALFCGGSS